MKSIEQQLSEALDRIKALTDENVKLKESVTAQAIAVATASLNTMITEAKLPEVAAVRLRKQFEKAEKIDGMKEAVAAESDYIKSLKESVPVRKNLGADSRGVSNGKDQKVVNAELKESLVKGGMSEKEADEFIKG